MRLSFSAQSFPAPRHEHVLGKDDIARVDSDHLSTLLLHSSMRPRVVTPKLQRQQYGFMAFQPAIYAREAIWMIPSDQSKAMWGNGRIPSSPTEFPEKTPVDMSN
jgi:hypothetical protein